MASARNNRSSPDDTVRTAKPTFRLTIKSEDAR